MRMNLFFAGNGEGQRQETNETEWKGLTKGNQVGRKFHAGGQLSFIFDHTFGRGAS